MENQLFTIKNYKNNSIICLENTKVLDHLYLIKKGKVQKLVNYYEKEEVETLKDGDTFGFISCLTGMVNIERITTMTDCEIILIHKKNLIPFLSQKSEVFLKIIKYYSNKLRNLDELYNELSGTQNITSDGQILANAVEYFHENNFIEQRNYAFSQYKIHCTNKSKVAALEKKYHLQPQKIVDLKTRVQFKKEDIIFLEQETGEHFYFIEQGKVKICHIHPNREVILSILKEGEFFGEMALLNRTTRMASAIAFDNCKLLVLERQNFMEKVGDKILQKIFISLASRLYHTYRRVINLHFENPVSRLYDCIDYLICTKQGLSHDRSFHFYFALEELKRMTDLVEAKDKEIQEFLRDDNIRFNYGEMVIIDIENFYLKLRRYTGIEHK
ncbi:MAG: cyclic nucleotide-binding domain-containing protein [Spirochaetes bacterium]|nr:cyclic nucleotide-binding domain-containing protein [Spirochaetota bacterium]